MAKLVLVRHGQSVWNVKGLWTGRTDIDLTEQGIAEAKKAGEALHDIPFSVAFLPPLIRARRTLEAIRTQLVQKEFPEIVAQEIIERDYGDLTGKNKWDVEKEYGEKQFLAWRRGWETRPPNGESLQDVYNRFIPYYQSHILPLLLKNENILIVSSGNALRALVKNLEHLSDSQIEDVEIKTGEVWEYTMDTNGAVENKKILATNTNPGEQ